jgi:hypothetical protein
VIFVGLWANSLRDRPLPKCRWGSEAFLHEGLIECGNGNSALGNTRQPYVYLQPHHLHRYNEWRVPRAKVRFFILSILLSILSQPGPPSTVHILYRSTSLTSTHFSTYFISTDRSFWVKTRISLSVSGGGGGNGLANAGGIDSPKFAKDGGTSYLGQHPTWASALFVQTVRL